MEAPCLKPGRPLTSEGWLVCLFKLLYSSCFHSGLFLLPFCMLWWRVSLNWRVRFLPHSICSADELPKEKTLGTKRLLVIQALHCSSMLGGVSLWGERVVGEKTESASEGLLSISTELFSRGRTEKDTKKNQDCLRSPRSSDSLSSHSPRNVVKNVKVSGDLS